LRIAPNLLKVVIKVRMPWAGEVKLTRKDKNEVFLFKGISSESRV
jgi:hypothetical protein